MLKMTIDEASKYFGVSKEAIHNRIRRGSLQSIIENDTKLVIVDKKPIKRKPTLKVSKDEKYYALLQEQNDKLQAKVEMLEAETRTLRDQKEQMLIEERQKIEQIYKEKDEQLKNILSVISSQFMLNAPIQSQHQEEELVDAEIEPTIEEEVQSEIISLKKYLKQLKLSKKKSHKIKQRFKKKVKKDDRIIMVGDKCYIDISKYDYKDLLR